MSDSKFVDSVNVNGEERLFVASKVTEELLQDLKEKIGGDNGVFVAKWGVTPFSEMKEAYDSKKLLMLIYRDPLSPQVYTGFTLYLHSFNSETFYFSGTINSSVYSVGCNANEGWDVPSQKSIHDVGFVEL